MAANQRERKRPLSWRYREGGSGRTAKAKLLGPLVPVALAILIASQTVSRREAFAIFAGTQTVSEEVAPAFTHGLNVAFWASTLLLVAAAILSALRGCRRL